MHKIKAKNSQYQELCKALTTFEHEVDHDHEIVGDMDTGLFESVYKEICELFLNVYIEKFYDTDDIEGEKVLVDQKKALSNKEHKYAYVWKSICTAIDPNHLEKWSKEVAQSKWKHLQAEKNFIEEKKKSRGLFSRTFGSDALSDQEKE
jgi:hypothetical protein